MHWRDGFHLVHCSLSDSDVPQIAGSYVSPFYARRAQLFNRTNPNAITRHLWGYWSDNVIESVLFCNQHVDPLLAPGTQRLELAGLLVR
jgi:hypothetical protein